MRAQCFGGDEHRPCGLCERDEKDRGLQASVRENPSVSAKRVSKGFQALRTVANPCRAFWGLADGRRARYVARPLSLKRRMACGRWACTKLPPPTQPPALLISAGNTYAKAAPMASSSNDTP